EGVSAAHAVQDLQVLAVGGAGEALVPAPRDGAPVVVRGGVHRTQRVADHLEVRVLGGRGADHRLETGGVQIGEVFVHAFDLESEAGGEVLFVADHHVDRRGDALIDLLGLGLAADRLPQARPVVQVVGDHGAVLLGGRD